MIGASVMKELRHSSLTILRKFFLHAVKQDSLFIFVSLSGFSSTNIYNLQDNRYKGREAISLYPFYRFHSLQGHLDISRVILQRAHLCAQLTAGLKPGTFVFLTQVANHQPTRSLEFALPKIALVAAVISRMLKTWETLQNISGVLLNGQAVNTHIFQLVHQLRLLLALNFVPLPYLFCQCHMYFQL